MLSALPPAARTAIEDYQAMVVHRLNTILISCGLSTDRPSIQLELNPERIHVIAPLDLKFLSDHAVTLATNKDVVCDFNAFSSVLWGMLRKAEVTIDDVIRLTEENLVVDEPAASLNAGKKKADKSASKALSNEDRLAKKLSVLQGALVRVKHVANILRVFEGITSEAPSAQPIIIIAQQDITASARITRKLSGLLELMATASSSITAVGPTYIASRHVVFRAVEFTLGSMEMLLSTLVTREKIDVQPILSLFHSKQLWRTSGCGLISCKAYGKALFNLIRVLYARRGDFDNVDSVAVNFVLHRIAERPPFEWSVFKQLFFFPRERRVMDRPGGAALGLLMMMHAVHAQVEECLCITSDLEGAALSTVKTMRASVSKKIAEVERQTSTPLLSFYQLMAYAAARGMPEADLTDSKALVERAKATGLTNEPELLEPSLLRLLLAFAFTVSTSGGLVMHSALSADSTMALYDSINEHVFQIRRFASGGGEGLNSIGAVENTHAAELVRLVVANTTADLEESPAEQTEAEAASTDVGSQAKKQCTTPLAMVMQQKLTETVETMLTANEAWIKASAKAHKAAAVADTGKAFRDVTLSSAILLFIFFQSTAFVKQVELNPALHTMVRIFAFRAYFSEPASASVVANNRAQLVKVLMQQRLAYIAQRMQPSAVNEVIRNVLVPQSTAEAIKQSSGLQLAVVEGYLRSMATSSIAFVVADELMLKHWICIAMPVITNGRRPPLATAGLDFLIAPFLAKKTISPLLVPTYVAALVPTTTKPPYGNPSMDLVRHFARTVRIASQGIESCDGTALARLVEDPTSFVSRAMTDRAALQKLTPVSAVLLIVSALFDKLCLLWSTVPSNRAHAQQLFIVYFSALVNLLQCTNSAVLHRVCASVEAVEMELLHGTAPLQLSSLKHVGNVVDSVQGSTKRGLAEWYLKLTQRVNTDIESISKL